MKKNKEFSKKFFQGILIFIGFGTVFFVGFYLGRKASYRQNLANLSNQVEISEENHSQSPCPNFKADFGLFCQSIEILKSEYYQKDKLRDQDLLYGAIKGVLQATGDSYTEFMPPEEANEFKEDIQGSFGGVGIEIGFRQGNLKIIAPLKDTPGWRAGLKAGDIILKVDGEAIGSLSLSEVVRKIRGKIGTPVVLTIFREGWQEPKDIKIIRGKIEIPTMDWQMIEREGHQIAYLKIYNFNENLRDKFLKNAFAILFKQPDGIILDLRNNPGGYLDIAVDIAGWFLERGKMVVKERFGDGSEIPLKSKGNGFFAKKPLVVLINEGSASASEILAGALKEQRKVVLVGEKTFGKGSVQTVRYLKDKSSLKITIANWLTPNGNLIEKKGIEPDIKVENEKDKEIEFGSKDDKQFQKAVEVLLREIKENKEKSFLPKIYFKLQDFKVITH